METTIETIISLLNHEYVWVLVGVVFWELVFGRKGKVWRNIVRGMGAGGFVVAFDDELLARFNSWAIVDFEFFPWYLYIVAGFFADLILSKFIFKEKNET